MSNAFSKNRKRLNSNKTIFVDQTFVVAVYRLINETEKNVTDDTEGCSDTVKNSQKDSVKLTADVFSEECQTQGNTCF